MNKFNVFLLGGSPDEDTYSSHLLAQIAADYHNKINIIGCARVQLPIFSNDRNYLKCPQSTLLEQIIAKADAVVIASPTHNDTISCYLKNIIDHTSIPRGSNFWYQKPVAVISFVDQMHSSEKAHDDLVHLLQYIGADVCVQPSIRFCRSRNILGCDGQIMADTDKQLVSQLMDNLLLKVARQQAFAHRKPDHEIPLWNSWY